MAKGVVGRLLTHLDDFVCKYESTAEFENFLQVARQPQHSRSLVGSISLFPRGVIGGVFNWIFPSTIHQKRAVVQSKPAPLKAAPPPIPVKAAAPHPPLCGIPHRPQYALASSATASIMRGISIPKVDPECKDDSYWERLYNEGGGACEEPDAVDAEEMYIAERILFGSETMSGPDTVSSAEDDASFPAALPVHASTRTHAELHAAAAAAASSSSSPLHHAASALRDTVSDAGRSIEHDAQAFHAWLHKPFRPFQPSGEEGGREGEELQPWSLF